jgi:hypothetical protein
VPSSVASECYGPGPMAISRSPSDGVAES